MATTAAEPVFIDTNILIYAQQQLSPFHAPAVAKLHQLAAAGHALWISRQILREYLAAMSRPGATTPPVSMASLITDVQAFAQQFLEARKGVGSLFSTTGRDSPPLPAEWQVCQRQATGHPAV